MNFQVVYFPLIANMKLFKQTLIWPEISVFIALNMFYDDSVKCACVSTYQKKPTSLKLISSRTHFHASYEHTSLSALYGAQNLHHKM